MRLYRLTKELEYKRISTPPIVVTIIVLIYLCGFTTKETYKNTVEIVKDTCYVSVDQYDRFEYSFLYNDIKVRNKRAFIFEVKAMSERLGIPHEDLLGVMYFESRLNPKANNNGTALGLFQITSIARNHLNITKQEVLSSDEYDQLEWLEEYLSFWGVENINNFGELYTALYLPAYLKYPNKKIPQEILDVNPAYKKCRTIKEFQLFVTKKYKELKN